MKGQLASFKATGEASRHMLRVPVQAQEGKALIVEVALTDLVRTVPCGPTDRAHVCVCAWIDRYIDQIDRAGPRRPIG